MSILAADQVFTAFAALAAAQADLPHDAESEFALEHLLDGANLLETNLNEPHDLTDADAQLILDLATTSKTRGKQRGMPVTASCAHQCSIYHTPGRPCRPAKLQAAAWCLETE